MFNRAFIFKFIIFGIILSGFGVIVINFMSLNRRIVDLGSKASERETLQLHSIMKKQLNIKNSIRTYKIFLDKTKKEKILVCETGRGLNNILLFHGVNFSSKLWKKLGTIKRLHDWGYRVFAVDMPSYANRSLSTIDDKTSVRWMKKLIEKLNISNIVIISSSTSAKFVLPYIFQLNKREKSIRGLVFVSPMDVSNFDVKDYRKIQISTLIVQGRKDKKFRSTSEILKKIPKSQILLIQNASHLSNYQKVNEFHNGLEKFLKKLNNKSKLTNNNVKKLS